MRTTGINHLALVCRDMEETVAFYAGVLGMPLYKTVALPDGGQHFFFDCGGGDSVAFFWWPDAPPAAPGIASVNVAWVCSRVRRRMSGWVTPTRTRASA